MTGTQSERCSIMRMKPLLAGALALTATLLAPAAAHAAKPVCEVDRPVRFSGLNWESNLVLAGICLLYTSRCV